MSAEIPMMDLSWPLNPNHKCRFYVERGWESRWLLSVSFSNKDESLYVTPLYAREYVVQSIGGGARTSFAHDPGANFHLSFHESGVVNLTTSQANARLRKELSGKVEVRHIVTFQINSVDEFPIATLEQINNRKGGYMYLPIVGFQPAPLMLTVYCAKQAAGWSPPRLGNSMMLRYQAAMRGKDYGVHFVVWQDLEMPKGEGDLGLQFGGEDDSFYGV